MKAIVYEQYGPPEVCRLADVPVPDPATDEVLIKVYAASVNRTDSGFRSAKYFVSRFFSGLFKPKFPILGSDFAGEVIKTGTAVTKFKTGDRVFGFDDYGFGGHAEYVAKKQTASMAKIPSGCDWTTAAAIPEGAHYALSNIRAAKLKPGMTALVYGATGAIGSAALQLLRYFGLTTDAVCGREDIDLIKTLGARTVTDYQHEDFTQTDERYDFIFDAVGKSSYKVCKPLLTEKGIYVSTELGDGGINLLLALTTPIGGGKKLIFPIPKNLATDMAFLAERVGDGSFKPLIDRVYPIDQFLEAYRYVESGQKKGNVILKIAE